MIRTITANDVNQYSVKPLDLGFDAEAAEEMMPKSGTTGGKMFGSSAGNSGTSRPNLMLYPGE
ncbi:MAG: hypothetical protein NUV45_04740 [Tepidanaerobacteraceae bacterium]|jgi:hypothetical protein|nr:hypothetical protein [Tepidanaerobacteraceae bacterium]